ncbi:MAG: CARDB domain-containing protein [bacterium]
MKTKTSFIFGLLLVLVTLPATLGQAQTLPTPQLVFAGTEDYEANGKQWTRYKLALLNRSAYEGELFTAAPDLPPCGTNQNSARTWVDIFNRQGRKRIYGFCALKGPAELGHLWFAIEKGTAAPEAVYITITDRRTNTKVVSNVLPLSSPGISTSASPDSAATSDASNQPDLVVKEIVFDQAPSQIRVRVLNQGTGAAGSCHLALQSGLRNDPLVPTKQRVWTIEIPALPAGKGFSNVIDVTPLTQKDGPWQATIDRSNAVAESNESNNTLAYPSSNPGPLPLNFRRPDLVIAHFQLMDPSKGEVQVAVTNNGSGNAGPSTLRLIVWEPGKFEQKEAKTVFVKVQALHPGQTASVLALAGVPIINTKYSLYIDIGEAVAESNENNNRAEGNAGNFKP